MEMNNGRTISASKRVISFLLTLAMLFGMLPEIIPSAAAAPGDTPAQAWTDFLADIAATKAADTNIPAQSWGGNNSPTLAGMPDYDLVGSTYTAYTGRGLRYALTKAAVTPNTTVLLANDVNLDGHNWDRIAIMANGFTFDGQGHTIYNFYATDLNYDVVAMFGQSFALDTTIKNIKFKYAVVESLGRHTTHSKAAFLIMHHTGERLKVSNITVTDSWQEAKRGNVTGNNIWAGGIVGSSYAPTVVLASNYSTHPDRVQFENLYTERVAIQNERGCATQLVFNIGGGTIKNSYALDGLVISPNHSGGVITCCRYLGVENVFGNTTVYGGELTGGFTGVLHGPHEFKNCYFSGTLEGTGAIMGGFVGGVGYQQSATVDTRFENCYTTGGVGMGQTLPSMGGFIGSTSSVMAGFTVQSFHFDSAYTAGEVGSLDTDNMNHTDTVGGFLGDNSSRVMHPVLIATNTYYDKQMSGMREDIGLNAVSGMSGLLTRDAKSGTAGTGLADGNVTFSNPGDWVQSAGQYPQLAAFANPAAANWTGGNLNKIKAYSLASVQTPVLEDYEAEAQNIYDTVRDITAQVPFSLGGQWDYLTPSAKSTYTDVSGNTHDVVTFGTKTGDTHKWMTEFAPGIEWVQVKSSAGTATGSRNLRLVPTSLLYAGESKTLTAGETYAHMDDVTMTYATASTMGAGGYEFEGTYLGAVGAVSSVEGAKPTSGAGLASSGTVETTFYEISKADLDNYKGTAITASQLAALKKNVAGDGKDATWLGNTALANDDVGYYFVEYTWDIGDGRKVRGGKFLTVKPQNFETAIEIVQDATAVSPIPDNSGIVSVAAENITASVSGTTTVNKSFVSGVERNDETSVSWVIPESVYGTPKARLSGFKLTMGNSTLGTYEGVKSGDNISAMDNTFYMVNYNQDTGNYDVKGTSVNKAYTITSAPVSGGTKYTLTFDENIGTVTLSDGTIASANYQDAEGDAKVLVSFAATYDVIFRENDSTAPVAVTNLATGETYGNLPAAANAISKPGYTLIGWNTKLDGTGIAYNPADVMGSANVTYYPIWSAGGWSVTFNGTGVSSNGAATCVADTAYNAVLTPNAGYRLPNTITVEVNGVTMTDGVDYTYNPNTGALTVNQDKVTGPIVITAVGTRQYTVTVKYVDDASPANELVLANTYSIDAGDTATYTALDLDTIVGGWYALKDTKLNNVSQGKVNPYTISGAAADTEITFVYSRSQVNLTHTLTNISSSAADGKINKQENYTETLTANAGYNLPANITVERNGTALVRDTDYTYNAASGQIIIFGNKITDDIEIIASASAKVTATVSYKEEVSDQPIGVVWPAAATYAATQTHNVSAGDSVSTNAVDLTSKNYGYFELSKITVIENGISTDYPAAMSHTITPSGNATVIYYYKKAQVDVDLSNVNDITSSNPATETDKGGQYETTLTPDGGYRLPDSIVVEVGGSPLTPGTDYTYDPDTGKVTVIGDKVTDDIEIKASGVKVWIVTVSFIDDAATPTTLSTTKTYQVDDADSFIANAENLSSSYYIVKDIEVNGTSIASAADSHTITSVNADTAVTFIYTRDSVAVDNNLTGLVSSNPDISTPKGEDYDTIISAQPGYNLPSDITVEVKDPITGNYKELGPGEYTYNPSTGDVHIPGSSVTDDIRITASGDANYTVSYDGNGSAATPAAPIDSNTYLAGNTVTAAADPGLVHATDSTYIMVGWSKTQLASPLAKGDTAPADMVAADGSSTFQMPTSNVTLYAVWAEDTNDTDGDGTPDGNTIPDYLEDWYHVTYNGNNATGGTVPTDSNTYASGDGVQVQGNTGTLTRSDLILVGWTKTRVSAPLQKGDAEPSGMLKADGTDIMTMPASDVTLYAVWAEDTDSSNIPDYKENWYSVIYKANGGSGTVPTDSNTYAAASAITLKTKGGLFNGDLLFDGWTEEVSPAVLQAGDTPAYTIYNAGASFTMPAANVTLYAVWAEDLNDNGIPDYKESLYTVTYDNNQTALSGAVSGSVVDANSPYLAGMTVIAENGTALTPPANIAFVGWTETAVSAAIPKMGSDPAGLILAGDTFTMASANKTLYAVWADDENGNGYPDYKEGKYTVSYDANGGSGQPVDSTQYVTGTTVTVKNGASMTKPTGTNITLEGWSQTQVGILKTGDSAPLDMIAADGTATFTMGTTDVIYYAVWAEDTNDTDKDGTPEGNGTPDYKEPWYSVSYDGNSEDSGTAPTDSKKYVENTKVTVLANADFAKAHTDGSALMFIGWSDAAQPVLEKGDTPTYTIYGAGDTLYMGTANITLYAVWAADTNDTDGNGSPDGNGTPDYLETWYGITYHANASLTSGAAPTDSNTYALGDVAPIEGNSGAMVYANATYSNNNMLVGWSETVSSLLTFGDTAPADMIAADGSATLSMPANAVDLYAVWAEDSNNNGIPDYKETLYTVTNNLTNITTDNSATTINKNTVYTENLTADAGFNLPATITVTVGGITLAPAAYTYNPATGEVTIPANRVNGDIVITAAAVNSLSVTVQLRDDQGRMMTAVSAAPAALVADKTSNLSAGDNFTAYAVDLSSKVYGYFEVSDILVDGVSTGTAADSYALTSVSANKVVTFVYSKAQVDVDLSNVNDITSSNPATETDKGDPYETTLTPDGGYRLPDSIVVEVGGSPLTPGTDYTYDPDTGKVTVIGDKVIDDIEIKASGVKVWTITVEFVDDDSPANTLVANKTYTVDNLEANYVVNAEDLNNAAGGYYVVKDIVVDGTSLATAGNTHTIASVTADTVVTFVYTSNTVLVDHDLTKLTSSNTDTSTPKNQDYKTTLVPDAGYTLPTDIVVTIGGVPTTDYTYNPTTGEVTINGASVTDTVSIIASGVATSAAQATITVKYQDTLGAALSGNTVQNVSVGAVNVSVAAKTIANHEIVGVTVDGVAQTVADPFILTSVTNDVTVVFIYDSVKVGVDNQLSNLTNTNSATQTAKGQQYDGKLVADAGYDLPTSIDVKVDGVTLTPGTDYTYNPVTGDVTINAGSVTGDIVIKAAGVDNTGTAINVTVNHEDTLGATLAASSTQAVTSGGNATLYAETIANYTVSDILVDGISTGAAAASYTLTGVTANTVVTFVYAKNTVNVDLTDVNNITSTNPDVTTPIGQDYDTTLVPDPNYDLPGSIVVEVGGVTLTPGTDYTYDPSTGDVHIPGANVTDDIKISADGVSTLTGTEVAVTNTVNNITADGAIKWDTSTKYEETLTPDTGYKLPNGITVTDNGVPLVQGTDYDYDPNTGKVVIYPNGNITGPVDIAADGIGIKVSVDNDLTNLTSSNPDAETPYGQDYDTTLVPTSPDVDLPSSIVVEVGGVILTPGTDYTYNPSTGDVHIPGANVTDDIKITAKGDVQPPVGPNDIVVDKNLDHITTPDGASTWDPSGPSYNATLVPDPNYELPDTITVTDGSGATLVDGVDYDYDPNTGAVEVYPNGSITGPLTISAEGTPEMVDVDTDVDNLTSSNPADETAKGQQYETTLDPDPGYELPGKIEVIVDGNVLPETDYVYNPSTGEVIIPGDKVTGDIEINASADVTVNENLTNITGTGDGSWDSSTTYETKLTPDSGYTLPNAIEVKDGNGTVLTPGTDYTYNQSTGEVVLNPNPSITGPVSINASGKASSTGGPSGPSGGNSYTLTFVTNGGSAIASITKSAGTTINLSSYVPTYAGHTFGGWYTDMTFTTKVTSVTLNSNMSVYASWTPGTTNGGSDSTLRITKTNADESKKLAGAVFKLEKKDASGNYQTVKTVTTGSLGTVTLQNMAYGDYRITETTAPTGYKLNTHSHYFTISDKSTLVTLRDHANDSSVKPDPGDWSSNGSGEDLKPELNTVDHFAYMQGYPDGTFRPNANMTRAEVAVMYSRLIAETMNPNAESGTNFSDVEAGQWYTDGIAIMESYGIITGYPDGTFRPNAPITRAEFAAIASRFDTLTSGTATFSDVSSDHWAAQYISFAADKGWVAGYPDGTFRPGQNITRAEVVTVVNRMLGRNADEAYVTANASRLKQYSDINATMWHYLDVCEASNGHDYVKDAGGKEAWIRLS